jgi:hypothetical protein
VKTFVVLSSDRGPCRRKSSAHFQGLQLASAAGMTPADGAATTFFTLFLYSPPHAIEFSLVCVWFSPSRSCKHLRSRVVVVGRVLGFERFDVMLVTLQALLEED